MNTPSHSLSPINYIFILHFYDIIWPWINTCVPTPHLPPIEYIFTFFYHITWPQMQCSAMPNISVQWKSFHCSVIDCCAVGFAAECRHCPGHGAALAFLLGRDISLPTLHLLIPPPLFPPLSPPSPFLPLPPFSPSTTSMYIPPGFSPRTRYLSPYP